MCFRVFERLLIQFRVFKCVLQTISSRLVENICAYERLLIRFRVLKRVLSVYVRFLPVGLLLLGFRLFSWVVVRLSDC